MRTTYIMLLLTLLISTGVHAEPSIEVSCENVHALYVHEGSSGWMVSMQLTPDGSKVLYDLTAKHVGEYIPVVAQSKELANYLVRGPVFSGTTGVNAGSKKDALKIAHLICPNKLKPLAPELTLEEIKDLEIPTHFPKGVTSHAYEVSCDSIANIRIQQNHDYVWKENSPNGSFYYVIIDLKKNAASTFADFLQSTEYSFFLEGDTMHHAKPIQFITKNSAIISDAPRMDSFSKDSATIIKRTKQAAFDTAAVLCPDIKPLFLNTQRN